MSMPSANVLLISAQPADKARVADALQAIRGQPYRLEVTSTLAEGLVRLKHGRVDAILLDLHVGQGDGRELLASLGDTRPPVALFTGSEAIIPELRELADAVLVKPLGIEKLSETVARLVDPAR